MNKLICLLLVCFGVNANSLNLLCEGNLSWKYQQQTGTPFLETRSNYAENALVEIYVKYQGDLSVTPQRWSRGVDDGKSYIQMPKVKNFDGGYNNNHRIHEARFLESRYEFVIRVHTGNRTKINIDRRTGRITLVGRNHRYDGRCEPMKENKF